MSIQKKKKELGEASLKNTCLFYCLLRVVTLNTYMHTCDALIQVTNIQKKHAYEFTHSIALYML